MRVAALVVVASLALGATPDPRVAQGLALAARAQEARKKMDAVLAAGPYEPRRESLARHPVPDWYVDAKLGIFLDWGLYSIAGYDEKAWKKARYPDWYLNSMYAGLKDYHARTWGPGFERDDFLPLFTAEGFDAERVAELVAGSGARYVVPFAKHHDGFCLWDSSFTGRDVVDQKPGFDVTRQLVDACRRRSLKYGFYFSVEEYEYPALLPDGSIALRLWNDGMAHGTATRKQDGETLMALEAIHERRITGKLPVPRFVDDYIVPQAMEFLDRYEPDILWFDGEWERPSDYYRTRDLAAYFYDRAEGRREVVVNDRFGSESRRSYGDFFTSETDEITQPIDRIWEENRSMSGSYGYNRTDREGDHLSATDLVHMLVRIVARGGNLNLMVNPDGSGGIPEPQVTRLREIGRWLRTNGEAIYGSRRSEAVSEDTQLGERVFYTRSKDGRYGYAILLDFPREETVILPKARPRHGAAVRLLGVDEPLEWVDTGEKAYGMVVRIPSALRDDPARRPCEHAWVIRFERDAAGEP